jgi:adenosylmethionine-8-amino-7-oxononanoate aminotransferase
MSTVFTSAVLHRSLKIDFPRIVGSEGNYVTLEDGRRILDASGGAAVVCIGHGNTRVHDAIAAQLKQVSYCSTTFYTTDVCEKLCEELVDSTHGVMKRAYIVNSGVYIKLAPQHIIPNTEYQARRQWRPL